MDMPESRIPVTPKAAPALVTLMADGSLTVLQDNVALLDVQRLLLTAAATITERTISRAAHMERVLAGLQARYDGFGEDMDRAIALALNPALASPPPPSE